MPKFDPQALVHRRLTFTWYGLRFKGRVVAAGYRTPFVVYRGNRDPVPSITVAPDGTVSANSTDPQDVIRIDVGSELYKSITFE